MQCYTQLLPPSAVTHAVALPFLDAASRNLVVVKTCVLQVFRLRAVKHHSDDSATKSRLVLVGEYPLAGTVTSLAAIKAENTKSGGEALLIAFKDAKVSLVEWDSDNYRLNTISIHYYEGENVIHEPFGPSLSECESILTVDPTSRCAALKFGSRHLAILPFRQAGDELMEGGEDGYDEDMATAPPSAMLKRTQSGLNEGEAKQTPYKSSFVLPLTALDPDLSHPVDLAFLHEYREPTFGILSAPVQPSSALLEARKDSLSYTVFTLDLDQRASTNLITAQKLPSDLWKVVPLPLPVGGALLIGTNEFVHVDQSGKTSAVAVNQFTKAASNLAMADQSELNMKLEGCEVGKLDSKSGDLVVVLNDGTMAVLSFRLSGRNVAGLLVTRVTTENGGRLPEVAPSSVTLMNGNTLFVGSEDGDSFVLSWSRSVPTLSRKHSHAQMLGQDIPVEEDEEDEEMDDDDLYATAPEAAKRTSSAGANGSVDSSTYSFTLQDRLPSLGPINNVCLGRSSAVSKDELELVAGIGRGSGSKLATLRKEIVPNAVRTEKEVFAEAKNIWSIKAASTQPGSAEPMRVEHDSMVFCFNGEITRVYDISSAAVDGSDSSSYTERTGTDFEHDGETLQINTIAKGTRVVQCRRTELRIYDAADLSLAQIIPMTDEETDAELEIVHVSFSDPYIVVLRDDSSVLALQLEKGGDVEPLDSPAAISERKWLSGCLYTGSLCPDETIVCLLGEEGGLHMFSLPDLQQFYHAPTLCYLPPVLEAGARQRRVGAKETLTELLITDIGTEDSKEPYLMVRSAMDDLNLYQPWSAGSSWKEVLRFRKVTLDYIPKFDGSTPDESNGRPAPLQQVRVGRFDAVVVPGAYPSFLLKEAAALPKVVPLRAHNVKALIPLHRPGCDSGFAILRSATSSDDEGVETKKLELQELALPADAEFSTGWCVQKQTFGDPAEQVRDVAYHEERGMYVVATCRDVDFHLEGDKEEGRGKGNDGISLHPQVPQYTLHLLKAKTRHVIHSYSLPNLETITSLKIMPLEISEQTHDIEARIVVGTATQRGEDMPSKGAVNVFEILDVVPDPDRAESGAKLNLVSREETRGAVTALESFPGGLIGIGQGQKIMIRGLKEDGSCLPVAFLDCQCYTTSLKQLGGSGLWLAADAWKGLWFGGFTQEPYKLTTLGKSRTHMEVVCAEFLPFDGNLFLLIVDAAMDLHVLQYDPENPKSLSGTRLLHRSTFHLGQFPSSMALLPSTLSPPVSQPLTNGHDSTEETQTNAPSLYHVLITSHTGSLSLITPLDEGTYRRLGSLQTHLTSVLEHAAGLNPRAYRAVESEGGGGRGVVDGEVVKRVWELGSARRAEVLGRAGIDGWGARSDLEAVGGGGLGYL
ncbi:mRNA cleavage and polyadenylation factor subunit [Saxophila tyrrhenica]|uniref:mRNA cleavage and polyadenylation factor subunit n=1 Tax=Saxophila tyrrhenica TaxID=1690608 RepID=A0AAV9PIF9_9PEZI|nr:mRNA cleavage and polyadenylation factor subunit [Saxophila tyrrhenica]